MHWDRYCGHQNHHFGPGSFLPNFPLLQTLKIGPLSRSPQWNLICLVRNSTVCRKLQYSLVIDWLYLRLLPLWGSGSKKVGPGRPYFNGAAASEALAATNGGACCGTQHGLPRGRPEVAGALFVLLLLGCIPIYQYINHRPIHRIGRMESYFTFAPCLLYTSPSPRDVEESRMPSSA